jgi:hypothetical protein
LKHRVQLRMDAGGDHFQHLVWRDAVSQGLRCKYIPTTFYHYRCIGGFIAGSLVPLAKGPLWYNLTDKPV